MDIVAYSLEAGGSSFSLRLRGTLQWRIKINDERYGPPYDTAQDAVDSLSRSHGVPAELGAWTAESSRDSMLGML